MALPNSGVPCDTFANGYPFVQVQDTNINRKLGHFRLLLLGVVPGLSLFRDMPPPSRAAQRDPGMPSRRHPIRLSTKQREQGEEGDGRLNKVALVSRVPTSQKRKKRRGAEIDWMRCLDDLTSDDALLEPQRGKMG